MTVSSGKRLPLMLALVAIAVLVTAAFVRPPPLPVGAARFADLPAPTSSRKPQASRTYAFDVLISGNTQTLIGSAPVRVPAGGMVEIVGWAVDPRTMKPPSSLLTGLDRKAAATPVKQLGLSRPDVAAALHDGDAAGSGFHAQVSLIGLGHGLHQVHFTVVGPDGHRIDLPTSVSLLVH